MLSKEELEELIKMYIGKTTNFSWTEIGNDKPSIDSQNPFVAIYTRRNWLAGTDHYTKNDATKSIGDLGKQLGRMDSRANNQYAKGLYGNIGDVVGRNMSGSEYQMYGKQPTYGKLATYGNKNNAAGSKATAYGKGSGKAGYGTGKGGYGSGKGASAGSSAGGK